MKKLKLISLICAICFADIASSNSLCSLQARPGKKAVKINDLPGYFFKVHPDGEFLSYIGSGGNRIINMESGAEYKSLGGVDPVWSPDGKFLTYPSGGEEGPKMVFHHGDELIKNSVSGNPEQTKEYSDKFGGAYQSIGKIGDKYRMITDANGVSIAEYTYDKDGPKKVSEVKELCPGVDGFTSDLPMLSKDGKYIAVYSNTTSSTRIFNVDSCSLALDLGFATGKVSFNNDSSQISFHVDQYSDFESGYFSGISKDKVKNVVVMNLESSNKEKTLTPASWALVSSHTTPGNGGYYPDFDKNGNLYHLEDVDNYFQFVKTTQTDIEWMNFDLRNFKDFSGCEDCAKKGKSAMEQLAQLWTSVCDKETKVDLVMAPVLAAAIDPVECQKMVQEFWTKELEISKADLLLACPKKTNTDHLSINEWSTDRDISAEKIIGSRCVMCHTQKMEYEGKYNYYVSTRPGTYKQESYKAPKTLAPINLTNLDAKTIQYMVEAIQSGDMPKGSSLDQKEKELLNQYLRRKLLDVPNADRDMAPQMLNQYPEVELGKLREATRVQNPGLPEEQLKQILYQSDCIYGQKNCQEYIDTMMPNILLYSQQLPEQERAPYVEKKVIQMKCLNYFEITMNECRIWKENNPEH